MRITRADAERLGLDWDSLWRQAAPVSPIGEKSHTQVSRVAVPGEPRLLSAVAGDGWWECAIVEWRPSSKNVKSGGPWRWHAARKRDDATVAIWLEHPAAPPRATGKRRVYLTATRKRTAGRTVDPQNLVESVADALVNCGLLVDDSAKWCSVAEPAVGQDPGQEWGWMTRIRLEDI